MFFSLEKSEKCFYQGNNAYHQITDKEAPSILSPEETRGIPGDEDAAEDKSSVGLEQVVHVDRARNLLLIKFYKPLLNIIQKNFH